MNTTIRPSRRLRRLRMLPVALLLALVPACGTDDGGNDAEPPTFDESPSETSSALPDGVPTRTPEAPGAKQTEAGAKAFAEYVFDTYWYSLTQVRSIDPLLALTASGRCGLCDDTAEVIQRLREEGIRQVPDQPPEPKSLTVLHQGPKKTLVGVSYGLSAGRTIKDDGTVGETLPPRKNAYMEVTMAWKGQQWVLVDYAFPE